jgi:hypothetical protein
MPLFAVTVRTDYVNARMQYVPPVTSTISFAMDVMFAMPWNGRWYSTARVSDVEYDANNGIEHMERKSDALWLPQFLASSELFGASVYKVRLPCAKDNVHF